MEQLNYTQIDNKGQSVSDNAKLVKDFYSQKMSIVSKRTHELHQIGFN